MRQLEDVASFLDRMAERALELHPGNVAHNARELAGLLRGEADIIRRDLTRQRHDFAAASIPVLQSIVEGDFVDQATYEQAVEALEAARADVEETS